MGPEPDEARVLALVQELQEDAWPRRREAAEQAGRALEELEAKPLLRLLRDALLNHCDDPKWEVRRAVALALGHAHLPGAKRIQRALEKLTRDVYPEVQAAAADAVSRRLPDTGRWEAPGDSALVEYVSARVDQVAGRRVAHRQLFQVISECGEHYYRLLASDTTHQIRSRLQPIVSALGRLRMYLDESGKADAETARHLADSKFHAERLERLLDDLRLYTRESREIAPVELRGLLEGALAEARQRVEAVDLDLTGVAEALDVQTGLCVEADEQALREALINLLVNAYYATSPAGELSVQAARTSDGVQVVVRDTGPGMSEERLEQCTRRWITTRRREGGSGLGLPIAKRIVEGLHQGSLEIESEPGNGTTVTLHLPLRQEPA